MHLHMYIQIRTRRLHITSFAPCHSHVGSAKLRGALVEGCIEFRMAEVRPSPFSLKACVREDAGEAGEAPVPLRRPRPPLIAFPLVFFAWPFLPLLSLCLPPFFTAVTVWDGAAAERLCALAAKALRDCGDVMKLVRCSSAALRELDGPALPRAVAPSAVQSRLPGSCPCEVRQRVDVWRKPQSSSLLLSRDSCASSLSLIAAQRIADGACVAAYDRCCCCCSCASSKSRRCSANSASWKRRSSSSCS